MREETILLVEDNPNDQILTLRALRKIGLAGEQIAVARDGVEALDYLFGASASRRPLPRLVLLNLKLPKVNGLEVLRHLRADERTRLLPVVILTSSRGATQHDRLPARRRLDLEGRGFRPVHARGGPAQAIAQG